jgi:hypothetical protein
VSTIQDHADAGLDLLRADADLTVYDGEVGKNPPDRYVLVYTFRLRPDGLTAPDKIPLTGASIAVDMRMYCHCVGATASAARAIQGRVEALLLDVTPSVPERTCFPVRLLDGQQAIRNEQTLTSVFDNVDVYGWTSVPG